MKRISIVAAMLVIGSVMACGRTDRPAQTATSSASVTAKEAAKDGGTLTPLVPDDALVASDQRDSGTSARDGGSLGFVSTRGAD